MAWTSRFPLASHVGVAALLLLVVIVTTSWAGDLSFRRHVISESSEYSAVAAFDVNHDGQHDILCGGFWYEAPTWKRHFVRDVERIGRRFDGYSHLPLDVNGDGWTDVITVNFRSRSIRWIEHPGADFGPWQIHTVAEPGAMETGRLVDVDGDGRLDVLPNGQRFAAWWELPSAESGRSWVRHELPLEVAGHGMGFGDIDGDGRGDVVGPRGWAAAPANPRQDRWIWNRDFELGRASVPVMVADVDADGDNDLVWTRAHGFGVYWMEQSRNESGRRTWIHHTIDTSWSQCHSPLWADMDGDGQLELVAGKRYMAHEGRDPGAYEPLVSYRYQFQPTTKTWQRWVISAGEQVGFGLDPKVIDLDADGDLDLVVCGRSGLYWLENEGDRSEDLAEAIAAATPGAALMVVKDQHGGETPVTTPFDWGRRRAQVVHSIEQVCGQLPAPQQRVPLDIQSEMQQLKGDLLRRKLSYLAEAGVRVGAELWLPSAAAHAPAVIYLAAAADQSARDDAQALAARGYACLILESSSRTTPDSPSPAASSASTPAMADIWKCVRGVDVLESLPQVDGERLACVARGRDAVLGIYLVAIDQRLAATWCAGALPTSDQRALKPNAPSLAELVAAVAPRAVTLRVPESTPAATLESWNRSVDQASAAFRLNPRAQPPTLALATQRTGPSLPAWLEKQFPPRGPARPASR